MIHFGEKLRNLADQQGVSVSQIASKMGKTSKAIYDDLNKVDLSTSVLRQYAKVFSIDLEDLFQDTSTLALKKEEPLMFKEDELEYIRKSGKDCESCPFAQQLLRIIHTQNDHITSLTQTLNNITGK